MNVQAATPHVSFVHISEATKNHSNPIKALIFDRAAAANRSLVAPRSSTRAAAGIRSFQHFDVPFTVFASTCSDGSRPAARLDRQQRAPPLGLFDILSIHDGIHIKR